jgi:hypothetical protein
MWDTQADGQTQTETSLNLYVKSNVKHVAVMEHAV